MRGFYYNGQYYKPTKELRKQCRGIIFPPRINIDVDAISLVLLVAFFIYIIVCLAQNTFTGELSAWNFLSWIKAFLKWKGMM